MRATSRWRCILLILATLTAAPTLAKPPNILLRYADDQRNHTLGCAGHAIVKTPHLDRLFIRAGVTQD